MTHQRSQYSTVLVAIGLVLFGVVWIYFSPVEFGGRAAYVIINGNSMEPRFHRGDLVILQQADTFQIGDIVTYRHPDIGPVIHRIVNKEGRQFVLQGDNNDWIDTYRPVQSEMIGKFWLHIPYAGNIVEQLRTPWGMALVVAVIGAFLVSGSASHSKPRQIHFRRKHKQTKRQQFTMSQPSGNKTDLLFLLAVLSLAFGLLAFFSFSKPLTRATTTNLSYEQHGLFDYTATAPPGLYTANSAQTGDPIFRQLINRVAIDFSYRVETQHPADLAGTYRLIAVVSHNSGWTWQTELQPETAFTGSSFETSGVIDLSQIQAKIDNLEQQTGLEGQQYTLQIRPEVNLVGSIGSVSLRTQFSPLLNFFLNDLVMQPVSDLRESEDPLTPSQIGLLASPTTESNTLSVFNFQLPVSVARWMAGIGLTLSLGGLVVLAVVAFQTGYDDDDARIQARYGDLLVTVRDIKWLRDDSHIIEISTIADLVKIAERNDQMILHYLHNSVHHYFVQSDQIIYRYQPQREMEQMAAASKRTE